MTTTAKRKPAKRMAPVPAGAPVNARAMLVRLNIRVWDARKLDRKTSREVNEERHVETDAGRYIKRLFGGRKAAPSHSAVLNAGGSCRSTHFEQTLPWTDDSWRLLPSANYFGYMKEIGKKRDQFESALATFYDEYDSLCARAKDRLGNLHEPKDYPTLEQVKRKFEITIEFSPLPAAGDFRLDDLPADALAEIERATTERVAKATAQAMEDAWYRLHSAVDRVRERLADPDAIFRDSLIGNVRDLTEILARLNVTNDAGLETMRQRVSKELASLDPDVLRKNEKQRSNAADAAQDILDAMMNTYGFKPKQETQ